MFRCLPALLSLIVASSALAAAALPKDGAPAPIPDKIEFNRDVRAILSDRCFACHGPDINKRKAKLRLDVPEGAIAKGTENTFIILPGKPEQSEVWKRIVSTDDDERMPPANIGNSHLKPLTDREKAIIRKWIEQGAKYEGHWAYIKPSKPAPPEGAAVQEQLFVRNNIDKFIIAKLRGENLTPSKEADRRTLIRRLSFDLIGLPPTHAEVEAFVNDKSPDAYEKLVERLLASKHFGERLAVYWLDLVRYADSAGYHSDNDRTVWMYRDYVINAFNTNKRFDRFTLEQIAGDLLPDVSTETRIASGYNKLLCTTEEGGAQPREYTAKYAADRVRNVSTVWLGATMGCCECHDHKYDPLPTKDFYSMAAFFADVQEAAVGRQAQTPIPTPEHEAKLKEFDAKITAAQKKLTEPTKELVEAQAKWEAELQKKIASTTGRDDLNWIEDQRTPEGATRDGTFDFISKGKGPTRNDKHSRKQQAGELVQHFVIGAKDTIKLGKGDVLFVYVYLDPVDAPKQVMLQVNDGSWEHRAFWGEDKIPYGNVGSNTPAHRKLGPLPKTGEWVRLEVKPSDIGLKEGSVINGMAFTQWGGVAYWDAAGVNRDGIGAPDAVVQALKVPADKRDAKQKETIAAHYRDISPLMEPIRKEIANLKAQREATAKTLPTTLVTMAVAPRTIKILARGNWLDDSGEVVQPQVPVVFGKLDVKDRRATRLDLAQWLVAKENPIVSRVFVNRLWKLYFGQGIVKTLEDFGSQGAWPTHPELLDWLALEFVDSGYDVKHMIRLMVTSGTYRQSSNTNEAMRQRDPFNYLLARQGRFRLEAEFIRDNALAVSGLLAPQIGGPSVKPYQPRGYWAYLNFPTREWQNDKGDGLYRRGLYTWWQRTFLHPSLVAFDASSREEAVCDRPRGNTPLQAMVLLNDPTYVEASRVLAERAIKEGGADKASRIDFVFRTALQRSPSKEEASVLATLLDKHLADYGKDKDAAQKLIAIGDKPAAKEIDASELAAWTSVTRVVLNLHETVTRE